MNKCSVCNEPLMNPQGKGTILVLGHHPEEEEIAALPFINRSGTVLKKELFRNKVDWKRLRLDHLWRHPPKKSPSQKAVDLKETSELNSKCLDYFMTNLLRDRYEAVLLVGAEATKALTGCSVSDWAGIPMQSDYFDGLVMCVPNPSQVFATPLGEVRLSIRKFCNEIRRRGYYE